jgi:hypothetical protein
VLARGDTIIVWVCQGSRCHEHKENVSMGGFRIVFLFMMNWEL